MRTMGEILLDLEKILDEMVNDQELQTGDILALIHSHLMVHNPDAFEEYDEDGTNPHFYYGPKE